MTDILQRHFVTFYSPGTFMAEDTTKPINAWNIDDAVAMAALITERHNAKPYGFRFTTRTRGPDDFDSRETAKSPMHYIGGKVETVEEVRRRGDPAERILLANMEGNGWDRIWRSTQGWSWTQPLRDDDLVVSE